MSTDNGILLSDFVGSSYEMDMRCASYEMSLNMFYEPIAKQNDGYTKGILRSVDGNESVAVLGDNPDSGCKGLYTCSRGPDGTPDLYAVYDGTLYRIKSGMTAFSMGKMTAPATQVKMCESGGVNSHVVVTVGSGTTFVCPTLTSDTLARVKAVSNPMNPYNSGTSIDPDTGDMTGYPLKATHCCQMGNRVFVNDSEYGQIFWSRPGAFQGGTLSVYRTEWNATSKTWDIVFESDGYTPKYKTVDADSYAWKDDSGAFQYMTVMSNSGDRVLAMETLNDNTIYVFGAHTFEAWALQDSDYVISNTRMGVQIGIRAPYSLAKINNRLAWLGAGAAGDNGVWMIDNGDNPVKISNPAIDRKLSKLANTSSSYGFGYTYGGHEFYILTIPDDDLTFVYDFTTGYWHNRSTRDAYRNVDHFWYPSFACNFNSKVYFGSYVANRLLLMNPSKHTEWDGRWIKRDRRSAVIISNLSKVIVNEFALICNVGNTEVLDESADGFKPRVMMRYSGDGGETWGNYVTETLGMAGDYEQNVRWTDLGMGTLFIIDVMLTDPADFQISMGKIRYTPTRTFV